MRTYSPSDYEYNYYHHHHPEFYIAGRYHIKTKTKKARIEMRAF